MFKLESSPERDIVMLAPNLEFTSFREAGGDIGGHVFARANATVNEHDNRVLRHLSSRSIVRRMRRRRALSLSENHALALEMHALDVGWLASRSTSVGVMSEFDAPIRIGLAGGAPRRHSRDLAVDEFDHASRRFGHGYFSKFVFNPLRLS